ncbi:MAG: hydrogenase formation protein HypD [candidate division WOR-3 bacterium]|nr:hydrogenase formation protein HypD [candidate division WOR-3 bacterium]MDW7987895.1 hydrogenase formation protein HypD [candidate division WOR-3 bacterium]
MEVCGTHTNVISASGIRRLVGNTVKLISGPGCPVCVTAQKDIDWIIALAQKSDVVITTFGDLMRVPGTESNLEQEKACGADIKIVYSPMDALMLAQKTDKNVVFIGVGFETTAPTIAITLIKAKKQRIKNFYLLPLLKLIPPALRKIAQDPRLKIDGFILPGHVSTIIGSKPYEFLVKEYLKPCVITGFEPPDILEALDNLYQQVKSKKYYVAIQYKRCVEVHGNLIAQNLMNEVFVPTDAEWRGLGIIPNSGLKLAKNYENFDVRQYYQITIPEPKRNFCRCGDVLLGLIVPSECSLFGKKCNPTHPVGPCMVSSEGACAAYYKYEH